MSSWNGVKKSLMSSSTNHLYEIEINMTYAMRPES